MMFMVEMAWVLGELNGYLVWMGEGVLRFLNSLDLMALTLCCFLLCLGERPSCGPREGRLVRFG